MITRAPHSLPPGKEADLHKLVQLTWINLAFRVSIVIVLFLVMGSSQAMRAAWLEDILTLLPPVAFLVSMHYRDRGPGADYPYGHQRVTIVAFLCSSVVLTLLGVFLIIDSSIHLLKAEHTTIGAIELFGHTVWMGWLMVAGLMYSVIPPLIIGRIQEKWAERVHEKTVHVDAKVSKADWMTGLAGVVGVLGVGMGLWWMDAAAALVIGLDVARDGFKNLAEATGDVLDRRPKSMVTGKASGMEEKLEAELAKLPWVKRAGVRLREEGHVLCGEAFVVPHSEANLTRHLWEAGQLLQEKDWRVLEVVVTSVDSLEEGGRKYYGHSP
ncbi:cation transporter [Kineobactrum salinum]|uniref:Cation transporter n=1 Tax=Kineobactrum salinum TaxID=2708301 RepID=A0A6C0TX63_9GAMM|nr:cation transporter [Kineobactrum salinum]QIB64420.1 cation transporter [Kineobactrum salinum]